MTVGVCSGSGGRKRYLVPLAQVSRVVAFMQWRRSPALEVPGTFSATRLEVTRYLFRGTRIRTVGAYETAPYALWLRRFGAHSLTLPEPFCDCVAESYKEVDGFVTKGSCIKEIAECNLRDAPQPVCLPTGHGGRRQLS